MDQLNLLSAAFTMHYLTDLNTYVLNNGTEFILHQEVISIPSFMPGGRNEDILYFDGQMKKQDKQIYVLSNQWGLCYLGYRSIEYTVIIGPYMELTPDLFNLTEKYCLNATENNELKVFFSQIHVLNEEKINSYSNTLQLFEMFGENANPVRIKQLENKPQLEKNYPVENDFAKVVNLRYKVEQDAMHAVSQGNKNKALEVLGSHNIIFSFSDRFPNQPLRRVKNLAIVLNTLLRTAAREAQVPPILIHRMSEKFALQIESQTQLFELQNLTEKLLMEYCDLVLEYSLSNYSIVTRNAIEYIINNYGQKIEIQEIANVCFVHPSHLVRKFKQETNMTIIAYQQNIRISNAKYLLRNINSPIEEIAWMVGYEDSSYFTRVFKRRTGYTPSEYRNKK